MVPGTKQMFTKHLGLPLLFISWALAYTPPDLASQGHKSTSLGPARLPPLHNMELSPLAFQAEASNPGCWEVPFNKFGNVQKILSLFLGASPLTGSNPGDTRI